MPIKMLSRGAGWALLGLLLIANLTVGVRLYSQEVKAVAARDDAYEQIRALSEAMALIHNNYVDEVDYAALTENALEGMADRLDPFSEYLNPDLYEEMKNDTSGQFGGLGLMVRLKDGVLVVAALLEDAPRLAGILPGDRIVQIDGKNADGIRMDDAVHLLRGNPGTRVTLRILRGKTDESRTIVLARSEIKVNPVADVRMIGDGVGYFRVTQFSEPAAGAVQSALDELQAKNMRGFVLDLRGNPGGLLRSAVAVSQKFLPPDVEIVSTLGRLPAENHSYVGRGRVHLTNFPMVVLVNGGSASAAEIVAGAFQDHHRAEVVGEKTFGKGTVQVLLPMSSGAALRLTTARYFTPSHRAIHQRGIEPDVAVPMKAEDWAALQDQRVRRGVGESGPVEEVEDVQLLKALEILQRRIAAAPAGV